MYAPQAVSVIDDNKGVTIFAPVNSAFTAIQSDIGSLNATQIGNVLLNHVITSSVSHARTALSVHARPTSNLTLLNIGVIFPFGS